MPWWNGSAPPSIAISPSGATRWIRICSHPQSETEAVAQMKRFCTERGAWMDENIDILRQYSHESKNKKFNH